MYIMSTALGEFVLRYKELINNPGKKTGFELQSSGTNLIYRANNLSTLTEEKQPELVKLLRRTWQEVTMSVFNERCEVKFDTFEKLVGELNRTRQKNNDRYARNLISNLANEIEKNLTEIIPNDIPKRFIYSIAEKRYEYSLFHVFDEQTCAIKDPESKFGLKFFFSITKDPAGKLKYKYTHCHGDSKSYTLTLKPDLTGCEIELCIGEMEPDIVIQLDRKDIIITTQLVIDDEYNCYNWPLLFKYNIHTNSKKLDRIGYFQIELYINHTQIFSHNNLQESIENINECEKKIIAKINEIRLKNRLDRTSAIDNKNLFI